MWNKRIRIKTTKWVETPGETFDEYMERCYSPERLAEFDSGDIGELYAEWNSDGCGGMPYYEKVADYLNTARPKKKPHRYAKALAKVKQADKKPFDPLDIIVWDDDDLPFN